MIPAKGRYHIRQLSLIAAYAVVYVLLTLSFGNISYGEVNLRLANILLGAVPIIGWPAIFGQTLGVLITASFSPLGPLDFVNVAPALFFSWLIWRLRSFSVLTGLTLYSVGLGISVSATIHYVTGAPLIVLLTYVTVGILLTTVVGGYVFYQCVRNRLSGLISVRQNNPSKQIRSLQFRENRFGLEESIMVRFGSHRIPYYENPHAVQPVNDIVLLHTTPTGQAV